MVWKPPIFFVTNWSAEQLEAFERQIRTCEYKEERTKNIVLAIPSVPIITKVDDGTLQNVTLLQFVREVYFNDLPPMGDFVVIEQGQEARYADNGKDKTTEKIQPRSGPD